MKNGGNDKKGQKKGKKGGDQEITKEILKRNKGKIERENTKNCRGVAWQECQ